MDDIDLFMAQGGGSGSADASFVYTPNPVPFVNSDVNSLLGNGSLPVVSTVTQQNSSAGLNMTGSGAASGNMLTSITSILNPQTATALGVAVGNAEKTLAQIKTGFTSGVAAGSNTNPLATWWLYASTTDKLIVGLAAVTLVVMLMQE